MGKQLRWSKALDRASEMGVIFDLLPAETARRPCPQLPLKADADTAGNAGRKVPMHNTGREQMQQKTLTLSPQRKRVANPAR